MNRGGRAQGTSTKRYVTILCCLQLEVYYRYLPTFDIRKIHKTAAKQSILDADDLDVVIG